MDYTYQTIVIDIAGAKALNTSIDYSDKLNSSFNKLTSIEFLETVNSNNRAYDIRVSSEEGVSEDFAPREHYLAMVSNGATKTFIPVKFEDRARKYDIIAGGKKLIIAVKHTEALGGGETIQIKAVCKLEK